MSDKLRNQINDLIRDEIQDVINDYVDAQEETEKSGLGFVGKEEDKELKVSICLLYTSPSPRDATLSRMPSSA